MTLDELPALVFPILRRNLNGLAGIESLKKKRFQLLFGSPLLVLSEEFTDILAWRAVAAVLDTALDVILQRLR